MRHNRPVSRERRQPNGLLPYTEAPRRLCQRIAALNAFLRMLATPRSQLLAAPDLPALCRTAQRIRGWFAGLCIAAFIAALGIVIGYRALPFALVPPALVALLGVFMVSAATASRLGRLTDARLSVEYAQRIGHLVDINPACAAYEASVRQQGRPFTRLDLDELGAIHLNNPVSRERPR